MLSTQCLVQRDGKEARVQAAELVPGDLVKLITGDRVPADMRIIESQDLKVLVQLSSYPSQAPRRLSHS